MDADQLFYSFCLGDNYDAVGDDISGDETKQIPTTEEEKRDLEKGKFVKWLKKTFKPSHQRVFGEGHLNPVLFFHLTKLSPDYIGGVISGLTYRIFY